VFTVTVDDGRGGTNTGTLTISGAVAPAVNLAPVITSASQSVERVAAGGTVTFSVQAVDPDPVPTAVGFAWTATSGTLGTPTGSTGTSQVVWTAPTPFNAEVYVRATVSDATGVSTTRMFTVFVATAGSTSTSTSTSTGVDTTAPTVSALSFSTSTDTSTSTSVTVDTSSGPATVAVAFTVADDLSGIAQVSVQLQSQSGAQIRTCSVTTPTDAPAPLTLGASCTIQFPQYSEAGIWQVKLLEITDGAGNKASLNSAALAAYSTTLTMVSSTVDITAPTVTAFSFTPTSVDATSAAASVTVTATIADDLSGFVFAGFMFSDPTGDQWQTCWMYRPQGSSGLRMFTGTCTVNIPRFSTAGAWQLGEVDLRDEATNEIRLTTADLVAKGFPVTLTVTSTPDATAPTLTAFAFTPTVDTGLADATVTVNVTMTDDLSGVDQVGVKFISPSGNQSKICYILPPSGSKPVSFTGSCSVVIPRYSEVGQWQVQWLYSLDGVSNYVEWGPADLLAGGFPATLVVTSGS
jgi:hypothetical protein